METAPLYTDLDGVPDGGEAVFVTTRDGVRIRVAIWSGDGRGVALVFPGRTEYVERYGHVVTQLLQRGLAVVVIDWRGQGLSDRDPAPLKRGYVAAFTDYQIDIEAALALPQVAALQGPRLLFSHSMGGAIALRALSEGLDVAAAVFSAPMWGLPYVGNFRFLLDAVDIFGKPFGLDHALVPGSSDSFYVHTQAFNGNVLTGNPVQYARMGAQLRAYPALGLAGATVHWAREAAREIVRLQDAAVPAIPVQVFLGSRESVVLPEAVKARAATLPGARLDVLAAGHHELWMETPEIQQEVWAVTDRFLEPVLA